MHVQFEEETEDEVGYRVHVLSVPAPHSCPSSPTIGLAHPCTVL